MALFRRFSSFLSRLSDLRCQRPVICCCHSRSPFRTAGSPESVLHIGHTCFFHFNVRASLVLHIKLVTEEYPNCSVFSYSTGFSGLDNSLAAISLRLRGSGKGELLKNAESKLTRQISITDSYSTFGNIYSTIANRIIPCIQI